MRRDLPALLLLTLASGCAAPDRAEPSLAPRAAEAIDPRLPVAADSQPGTVDPALARRLAELVSQVRSAAPSFAELEARAEQLAAAAGPMNSESWVVAQQALSVLVEQYGVTSRASADIDGLAADPIAARGWINPASQAAIAAAAAEVAAISTRQSESISRLTDRLER